MINHQSFITMTHSEALALWKQLLHLEPVRRDCVVEREDGIDLDALLSRHIDMWYAELLLTAPVERLPIEDLVSEVTLAVEDGVAVATVPVRAVRPVEWRLQGWRHSVTRFLLPDDPACRRQQNRWTRGMSHEPAIIDMGNHLLLYGVPAGVSTPELSLARCVVQPAGGVIVLHTSALDTIADYASRHNLPQYI